MSKTRRRLKLTAGEWWRFSAYDLKDGYIRPTSDAELTQYDPWTGQDGAPARRPYEDLANLIRHGRLELADRTLTPDTEADLLAWCQRYGLLGVLLHRLDKVVLPARIEAHGNTHSCVQDRYLRTPRGWQLVSTAEECDGAALAAGEPVGVMLHQLDSLEPVFEPFRQTWAEFFPTVPPDQRESYPYPRPTSEEFWTLYREPVHEFFRVATFLERALTTLAKGRGTFADGTPSQTASVVDDYALAVHELNAYASTVRWSLEPEQGKFVQRWTSPSLFSSLAMMVLQDISGGQVPRTCRTCGGVFISPAYQARYCSPRCRHTMNKRAVRKNARTKLQQRRKHGYKDNATNNRGHDE